MFIGREQDGIQRHWHSDTLNKTLVIKRRTKLLGVVSGIEVIKHQSVSIEMHARSMQILTNNQLFVCLFKAVLWNLEVERRGASSNSSRNVIV
jgi:hypothetical protein